MSTHGPSARPTEDDDLARLTEAMMLGAELLRQARRGDVQMVPGLEPIHLEVLGSLYRNGPMALTALAGDTATQLSTISRRVSRLEELGLVVKRPDVKDRRVQVAELTDAGTEAMLRVMRQRRDLVHRVVADWDAADVRLFGALLERLTAQLSLNRLR